MKHSVAFALITVGTLLPAAPGRAATLEAYFDFTRYGDTPAGSTITSKVPGGVVATVRTPITHSSDAGLVLDPGQDAAGTGVVLPGGTLQSLAGDFTLQIWYRTGSEVRPNTLLYGGSTSSIGDNSLVGDDALFVGYNSIGGRVRFVRPITSNGSRWGVDMAATPAGTGTAPNTLYDYVVVYDSAARRVTAYLDGVLVGAMGAPKFSGLPSLTSGLAIGGVQNSAFSEDRAAAVGIASFLIYRGALDAGQVAKIHSFGPRLAPADLRGADVAVAAASPSAPESVTPAAEVGPATEDSQADAQEPRSVRQALRRRYR